MTDLYLKGNYGLSIGERETKSTFESILNNDPKSAFINSFNALPENIEYITNNLDLFIQFINSYPGTPEEMATFLYEDCPNYLSKTESKNENSYNKLTVPQGYKEKFEELFGLEYNDNVPVFFLVAPYISAPIFYSLLKKFKDSYNSPVDNFLYYIKNNNINFNEKIDNTYYYYFYQALNHLKKGDYNNAYLFLELNENCSSPVYFHVDIPETLIKSMPFFQSIQEKYKARTGEKIYFSSSLSTFYQFLSLEKPEFFPFYIQSTDVSSSLTNFLNAKQLYLGNSLDEQGEFKDNETLPYVEMALKKLRDQEALFNDNDEAKIEEAMNKIKPKIILATLGISESLATKTNSIFGGERLRTHLKSQNFIQSLSYIEHNITGQILINKHDGYLFHVLTNYNNNLSFSNSVLYAAYDHRCQLIDEHNQKCDKSQNYSDYQYKPSLNLEFVLKEFNLTLDRVLFIAKDKPISDVYAKHYETSLELIISSLKDSKSQELCFSLLLHIHPELQNLYTIDNEKDFLNVSSEEFSQILKTMKTYFYRPLNPLEKKFSDVEFIEALPYSNTDDLSMASFNIFTANNNNYTNKNPQVFHTKFLELLNYKIKNNDALAIETAKELKPYLTHVLETMFFSKSYSESIYSPENLKNIFPSVKTAMNIVFKSGLWEKNELELIIKNIDNSKLSLYYYEDEKTYNDTFSYSGSISFSDKFRNSMKIFSDVFDDLETSIMNFNKPVAQQKAKLKKF